MIHVDSVLVSLVFPEETFVHIFGYEHPVRWRREGGGLNCIWDTFVARNPKGMRKELRKEYDTETTRIGRNHNPDLVNVSLTEILELWRRWFP